MMILSHIFTALLISVSLFWRPEPTSDNQVELIILGTIQDAGSPHIGCRRSCCASLSPEERHQRMVSSIAITDHASGNAWIFDATPDFPAQWELLKDAGGDSLAGIFITHAHIGHYTGLMYLGREALGAKGIPVYVMPGMQGFLQSNGPWDQLVALKNIRLLPIQADTPVRLSQDISVTPLQVPHRDEYSETVGYVIKGPRRRILFIPDIDKWGKWDRDLGEIIRSVDLAFIDGSFFDPSELNYRPIEEIPHPTVQETMKVLSSLPRKEKEKVYFIHMNHTNPILDKSSDEYKSLSPFNRADFLSTFQL